MKKNLKKKLVLNKVTIQNLSKKEASEIKGGLSVYICSYGYCGGSGLCDHHGNK